MPALEQIVIAWWRDQWGGASADLIIAGRTKHGMPSVDETELALIRAAEDAAAKIAAFIAHHEPTTR